MDSLVSGIIVFFSTGFGAMGSPVRLLACNILFVPAFAITAEVGNSVLLSECKAVFSRLGRKASPLPVLLIG